MGTEAVYELRPGETDAIERLLARLVREHPSAEAPAFLAEARRLAYAYLPEGLVRFVDAFRRTEFAPVAVVAGLSVDDEAIGPTPLHWKRQPDPRSTLREECYAVLVGSLLGDLFGWGTLQDGRLVQNVLPIPDQEQEQSGHGSLTTLAWHTEDGFHPYRCDYLSLLGLRNDERVPTTVGSLDAVTLTPRQRRVLAEPRFGIRPDNEHLRQRERESPPGPAGAALPGDWTDPPPTAVLFGDLRRPYLRIDPVFMAAVTGDHEAEEALTTIVGQLDAALQNVVIEPGMLCLVDNYRAVHGRQAFTPRYDGRDRWLKKTVLTRDLRKSRSARDGPDSRVLAPLPLAASSSYGAFR
jgi:L-asparagine oxygenase